MNTAQSTLADLRQKLEAVSLARAKRGDITITVSMEFLTALDALDSLTYWKLKQDGVVNCACPHPDENQCARIRDQKIDPETKDRRKCECMCHADDSDDFPPPVVYKPATRMPVPKMVSSCCKSTYHQATDKHPMILCNQCGQPCALVELPATG